MELILAKVSFYLGLDILNQLKPRLVATSWGSRLSQLWPYPLVGEKITDVKVPTRSVGPIDELKTLRLVDFKQLDSDPNKAILKIKQKIDLLEQDSFVKRIAGIEAWKQSEVYRTYLSLGKESMEQGMPIDAVISQRASQGLPTLNEAEFQALVKLNKMLEY